jgi:hypothetical protein
VTLFRRKQARNEGISTVSERRDPDVHEHDDRTENRFSE